MAKKKPTKKRTTKTAIEKKAAAEPSAKRVAKKTVAKPTIDEDAIGSAAGAVWGCLRDGGPQTITSMKRAVATPSDVTLMAIGWLAREGKLEFVTKGRSVTIGLR